MVVWDTSVDSLIYLIAQRSPPRTLFDCFPPTGVTPPEGLGGRFAAERLRF